MSKELVRLLREIEEMSGKLYSNTSQDKDLRVCKGSRGGTARRRVDYRLGRKSHIPRKLKEKPGNISGLVLLISVFS